MTPAPTPKRTPLPFRQVETERRYFFDMYDGEVPTLDDTGFQIGNLAMAQDEAVRCLAEVVKDALPDGIRRTFAVVVREEAGRPVLKASLSFVFDEL